jgi:hypothetical protein
MMVFSSEFPSNPHKQKMAFIPLSISFNPPILIEVATLVHQPFGQSFALHTCQYFESPLRHLTPSCLGIGSCYLIMPKLWRRLGRQRTRSQGCKPQTMTPPSTKLQTITLQKIARRSTASKTARSNSVKHHSVTSGSIKPPSIKSLSEEDGEMERLESASERYWACCGCSEGGMSTFIECCSECKHYRCEDCPLELLKHRMSDKSLSDAYAPLDEYA